MFASRLLVVVALALVSAQAWAASIIAPTAAVAADHPVASEVGVQILQAGGNAVDAAVAVGLTLGVVNPFASGIGGGGFLLVRDPASGEVHALDFREVAPRAAHRDLYLDADGQLMERASRDGGLAVGVPGEVAGWWAVHQRYGALPWADVVEPARALAAEGFAAGSLLEARLASNDQLDAFPALRDAFSLDGRLVVEGDVLVRSGLGETLAAVQADGPAGFYEGWVARDIVDSVARAGGILTLQDLLDYEPRWLAPVESTYRGHRIYGMPIPSSGGLVVAQVLEALEPLAIDRLGYDDAAFAHAVITALAFAFNDRANLLGDGVDRAAVTEAMLGPVRMRQIVQGFDPTDLGDVDRFGPPAAGEDDAGTSHFSVIDADGMAVACTTTVNFSFGSKVHTERSGIVMNNEMDDFTAQPGVPNGFGLMGNERNAVVAGHRPLSSMSPTLVVDDDGLVGALGGSGGPRIITGTLLALLQLIDFDATAEEAVSAPRFHHQWMPFVTFVEVGASPSWLSALPGMGHTVVPQPFGSAVQVVWRHDSGWQAASDPRKHGAPAGY